MEDILVDQGDAQAADDGKLGLRDVGIAPHLREDPPPCPEKALPLQDKRSRSILTGATGARFEIHPKRYSDYNRVLSGLESLALLFRYLEGSFVIAFHFYQQPNPIGRLTINRLSA